jgi:hypothetical protein
MSRKQGNGVGVCVYKMVVVRLISVLLQIPNKGQNINKLPLSRDSEHVIGQEPISRSVRRHALILSAKTACMPCMG